MRVKKIIKTVLLGIGALFMMVVLLALLFVCLFSIARAFDKDRNLIKATINEDMDKVVTLIEKGADVNAQDRDEIAHYRSESTPIIIASERGSLEIVRYLVKNGADVNFIDACDGTALMEASESGNLEIVKYLVENGANIHFKNYRGETALMDASAKGNLEVVKYLIEKGADVNVISKGYTALIVASDYSHLEVVKHLVEKGADVNIIVNGYTALIRASIRGNLEIVKILVENNANLDFQAFSGQTGLDFAKKNEHAEVVEYLESLR